MQSAQRWHIKKAARKAVVLGSLSTGSMALRRLAGGPRVRAVTYHRFGEAPRDPWCLAPEAFEEQMRWLAAQRLAVSLDDVLSFVRGEIDLADGSVLVTIDDGFRSVLTVAAPILRRYAIPGVVYVTTSAVGNGDAGTGAGEPFLAWDDVADLPAYGLTVGSHSHHHRSLAALSAADIVLEGRRSKELLDAHLGKAVTSFAYPFGMRRDESAATEAILRECGYSSIFISQHGTIRPRANPLRLPRVKIEAGEPLWVFKLLCRGGMDAWSLADRIL
jgi:peptidoglycan/xylan/chitin deacetylase (PgdA/CDA1 family)